MMPQISKETCLPSARSCRVWAVGRHPVMPPPFSPLHCNLTEGTAEGRHSPALTSKLLLSSSIIITIRFIVLVIYFPAGGKKIRKSKGKKKKKNTAQSPMKHRENKQSGLWHICPELYTPNMEQLVVRECQGSRHKNPKHSA